MIYYAFIIFFSNVAKSDSDLIATNNVNLDRPYLQQQSVKDQPYLYDIIDHSNNIYIHVCTRASP